MNTSDMEQNSMANEVDLLALIVIARRHLRIFVATALLVTAIGITVSAFLSGQYGYSVAVQLGGFRDEKNIFNLIEDPQTVMAELQTSIIPQVLDDYGQKYPDLAKRAPQIEVKVPLGSEAVVITTEGKANQEKMIVDILDSIARAFDDRQGVLLHQRVDTLRSLLIDTIAKSELDLTQLKKSRDAIVAKGDMTSKYLTLLLINDEISKLQNQLFILRQQDRKSTRLNSSHH